MSNNKIVERFVDSFASGDIEQISTFFADDIFYHNIPMEPARGKAAARALLEGFLASAEEVAFELIAQAEGVDGTVLNERIDKFKVNGKWIELPVMGAFEVEDGKIKSWRDYFDLADFQNQFAAVSGESSKS